MRIIIYGTGELGLLYIEKNKEREVIAFAVVDPKEFSFSGYPVINISEIPNHDYDKVVIAVQNWTVDSYLEVIADSLKELMGVGVPFDKILTLRPYFTYEDINLKTFEECINVRSRIFRELSVILRRNKVPGSVAECGVGRGVFASVINESFPDKTLYLFDTFKGFDERDLDYEPDRAKKKAKKCKTMFGKDSLTGIDVALSHCPYKTQCIIRAGYIPETFEGLENERFAFVNIDVDLYAPTLAALRFFAPRLAKGGVIWIHDYYSGPWQGVKEAVNEFALEYQFTLLPVGDKLSVALIPFREETNAKPTYHVEFKPEMGQQPLVSIIMPSLNVVNYIRECMESVINQTLKNIEIICVDADSNDGTLEILREYASRDKRITLIVSKKKSYGYQMNVGLDIATGKYMGIVETDDFVAHDMFEQLYKLAEKNNVDFIKADFYSFTVSPNKSLNKVYTEVCAKSGFYDKVFKPGDNPEAITFYPCTWSGIYNIDFMRRWKIRHNETSGASYQDNGFWIQTFCCAERAYLLNKPFYMYREDNPDSSKKNKGNVYCIIEEYAFALNFLKKNNLFNKTYIPVYLYKKYISYIFTYNRIAEKFKLPFIIKFHEEFKGVDEEGLLDTSLFTKFKRETLMQIINDPVTYYLKTSDYGKSKTTNDAKVLKVQNEVAGIKSSLSYKTGRAITFFPRKIVGGYKCFKDHELRYTIRRLFFKITRRGRCSYE